MRDEDLQLALASLPREEVGSEFTARVLGRIAARSRKRARSWRLAAAAMALLALLFGGRELWHREERHRAREHLASLQAEYQALEAEVQRLRRLSVAARPVVVLGGDSEVDLMVDLSRWQPSRLARLTGPAQTGQPAEGAAPEGAVPAKIQQDLLAEVLRPRAGARQIY